MNQRVALQFALWLMLALFAAMPAFAQNTSSAISGRIVDETGAPVAGATVEIEHVPSGTRKSVNASEDGRFTAQGLRVGGPYTVTASAEGKNNATKNDVYLLLGETTSVNLNMAAEATDLATVEVVASAAANVFNAEAMGAGTAIDRATIDALPSINRDLQDYARLDPRISQTDKERGEISALGQNTRFNSITIDSVSTNDTFGLESNNLPTARQPISLDAIESVQINVTNYDVTQRGYTGANINAVTKSGTNEFHGSVYTTYRDNDMIRETDDRGVKFTSFKEDTTLGATIGGPIIKDVLFFFINLESATIKAPAADYGSTPLDRATGGITTAQVNEVIGIAEGYGMDPGDLFSVGNDTEVDTALVRLDWNISDTQRASLRYSTTDQSQFIQPGFGVNFFSLSSHWYSQEKEFDNAVLELFSDWNDWFSTEARVSYRDYASVPDIYARQPQVQVDFGSQSFRFGTEQFRHQNVLNTETYNAYFAGNMYFGDHTLKLGFDWEQNDIYNLFLESNYGQYRFGSTANFRNGIYREYVVRVPTSGNVDDAAAAFSLDNWGFFAQDTWAVNYNLNLMYGFRIDRPGTDSDPVYNEAFQTTFGMRNDVNQDEAAIFQPRIGFNYTFDSERPMQARGGFGLFQGSAANVWLSNPFTNNGRTISIFGCGFAGSTANCPTTAPPAGRQFSADPDNQPVFGTARADVDLLAPGLKQPSVWKGNLAFEHELPWMGMIAGFEAIFTQVEDGIYYEHLNLGRVGRQGQDGRNLYWANTAPSQYNASTGFFGATSNARSGANQAFREVLLAKNTGKGNGESYTLSLQKPFRDEADWSAQIAYTYADASEVSGLTSSRAISNWASRAILNPNEEVSSRSPYVVNDRLNGSFTKRWKFFGDNTTEFSLFYEVRQGKPYSWTFNNDANGDGLAGNDLMYIPVAPGDVLFVGADAAARAAEEALFWERVNQLGLEGYAGQTIDRNTEYSPWTNSFDVRLSQEIPLWFDHKADVWLDILNVGNLLNKDWGEIDEVFFQSNGAQARSFVNFAGIDPATGRYVYDVINTEPLGRRDNRAESRWAIAVGFRYRF